MHPSNPGAQRPCVQAMRAVTAVLAVALLLPAKQQEREDEDGSPLGLAGRLKGGGDEEPEGPSPEPQKTVSVSARK